MVEINQFLKEISDFLNTFTWKTIDSTSEEFKRDYRRRTLEEIISSRYFLGCYEPALIVHEQAQKQDIKARFIETIDKRYGTDDIHAHCFVELNFNGQWVIINPTGQKPLRPLKKYPSWYVFFSEGPYRWHSFTELKKAQENFIRNRLQRQK